jgi:hypothetical protein
MGSADLFRIQNIQTDGQPYMHDRLSRVSSVHLVQRRVASVRNENL